MPGESFGPGHAQHVDHVVETVARTHVRQAEAPPRLGNASTFDPHVLDVVRGPAVGGDEPISGRALEAQADLDFRPIRGHGRGVMPGLLGGACLGEGASRSTWARGASEQHQSECGEQQARHESQCVIGPATLPWRNVPLGLGTYSDAGQEAVGNRSGPGVLPPCLTRAAPLDAFCDLVAASRTDADGRKGFESRALT